MPRERTWISGIKLTSQARRMAGPVGGADRHRKKSEGAATPRTRQTLFARWLHEPGSPRLQTALLGAPPNLRRTAGWRARSGLGRPQLGDPALGPSQLHRLRRWRAGQLPPVDAVLADPAEHGALGQRPPAPHGGRNGPAGRSSPESGLGRGTGHLPRQGHPPFSRRGSKERGDTSGGPLSKGSLRVFVCAVLARSSCA